MFGMVDSFKLLKKFPIAGYKVVNNLHEADFNFPFYLKADIAEHKTEKKAVLKCNNIEEAEVNFNFLQNQFPDKKIIMQKAVEGVEMIIGIKEDKIFGKLFMLGFGGIFAEAVKDVSFRALPVDRAEIEKMLIELKLISILTSRKKYALKEFILLAEKVSKLDVKEMDLNPVILNEKEAVIADARIEA